MVRFMFYISSSVPTTNSLMLFLPQLPATKSIMHQKYEGTLAVGSALQSSIQLQRRPFGLKQDFCTSLS